MSERENPRRLKLGEDPDTPVTGDTNPVVYSSKDEAVNDWPELPAGARIKSKASNRSRDKYG